MSVNHAGKEECIDNFVIKACYQFLDKEEYHDFNYALNASLVLMSCSIHLEGKNQIVD